jgi:lambda repressor-like predicted transcriptional regulator
MQILAVIQKHGFTLEQVANELGITKGSLSATISAYPNVKKMIDIAKIVGCHPAEFFDDWYENEGKGQQRPAEQPAEQTEAESSSIEHQEQMSKLEELVFGQHEQPLQPVAAFLCPHCNKAVTIGIMKN